MICIFRPLAKTRYISRQCTINRHKISHSPFSIYLPLGNASGPPKLLIGDPEHERPGPKPDPAGHEALVEGQGTLIADGGLEAVPDAAVVQT